jgi:hypothetical protein
MERKKRSFAAPATGVKTTSKPRIPVRIPIAREMAATQGIIDGLTGFGMATTFRVVSFHI